MPTVESLVSQHLEKAKRDYDRRTVEENAWRLAASMSEIAAEIAEEIKYRVSRTLEERYQIDANPLNVARVANAACRIIVKEAFACANQHQ